MNFTSITLSFFSTTNGKPTINPENNLLAAPGSVHAMSQNKQVRQLPPQTNGHPQQLKLAPGEVLVGQSPNPRLSTLDGQQLQSSSSSVMHDHPSGARPSTSSTISSDHFSSDYFSSNNSHECKHNDQTQYVPQGYNGIKPGQDVANQDTRTCLQNPALMVGQQPATILSQPSMEGSKIPVQYIQPNITQYHHNRSQNCDHHGVQFECQQRAASKLCDHLAHNYDSGEHSGENSHSEYTDDDEDYEEEGYEDGCERRMISIQQSTQNQSILKHTPTHYPDEHGYYNHDQNHRSSQVNKETSCNPRKISKTQKTTSGSQTYYEDQATQTEDEEEEDDVCHKHGCRYRKVQNQYQEDTSVLGGIGM